MATNRYALSDYELQITFPSAPNGEQRLPDLCIGGPGQNGYEGSFLGSIKVTRNNNLWDTDGDPTGSWVHSKNLNRTGTVELDIRQVSDDVLKFAYICSFYESNEQDTLGGCTIRIVNSYNGLAVAECLDCYITKVPDQNYGASAETQAWTFTSGCVRMYKDITLDSDGNVSY